MAIIKQTIPLIKDLQFFKKVLDIGFISVIAGKTLIALALAPLGQRTMISHTRATLIEA